MKEQLEQCEQCLQPQEWCTCDDPVQGDALEDLLIELPAEVALDFSSDPIREYEEHTFEDDFDRELPELEPDPDDLDLLEGEDLEALRRADDEYVNEGGRVEENEL